MNKPVILGALVLVLTMPVLPFDLPDLTRAIQSVPVKTTAITEENKCGRDAIIDFGTRRLSTNLWGAPLDENIPAGNNCVFKNFGSYGWSWERMEPLQTNNEYLPVYPSVITGTDPWGGYALTPNLPVKISNISSFMLDVRYSYTILPTDSVNLAYDVWITGPDSERYEVMIWINRKNVPMPEDKRVEDVGDGYNTYTQYAYGNYRAFIMNVEPSPGIKYHKADLGKFLKYLVTKGDLKEDYLVSRVDLGNEVWKGKGKMEILDFKMTVNKIII